MFIMKNVFMLQGFSKDLAFDDPSLDLLREAMAEHDIQLHGVENGWKDYGIRSFGMRAVEQYHDYPYKGILIGHSLGALAALSVLEFMPVRHLVLCSPSALFSEDIKSGLDPLVAVRIGKKRIQELSSFSVAEAVSSVNRLGMPTTIMFGERERVLHPRLVSRSCELADKIVNATLLEVPGAGHSIGENPYAFELSVVMGAIADSIND